MDKQRHAAECSISYAFQYVRFQNVNKPIFENWEIPTLYKSVGTVNDFFFFLALFSNIFNHPLRNWAMVVLFQINDLLRKAPAHRTFTSAHAVSGETYSWPTPTYPHSASLLCCQSSQHTKSVLSFRSLRLSVCDRDGAFQFATRSISSIVSDHCSGKGSLLEKYSGLE